MARGKKKSNQQPSFVPAAVQVMMEKNEPPFTSAIMSEVMPKRFRIPPVIQYSGSGDPSEHGPKESLKDFIACFNEEALQVEDYDDKMTLSAMFSGLKERKFTFSIGKNPPKTNVQVAESPTKGKRLRNEEPQLSSNKSNNQVPRDRRPSRKPKGTPPSIHLQSRYCWTSRDKLLNWPVCMKADAEHRNKRKYYRFHCDHDHNTSDCVDLKDEIETLIRKGHLCQYTKEERTTRREEQPSKVAKEPVEIHTIFGGSSGGGDSNRAHKSYSQKFDPEHYVHMIERLRKELRVSPCNLTFTEDDVRGIQHPMTMPYDNALVVTMTISNHKVYRILVDTGSSTDVIYSEAFKRMTILRSHLRPVKTLLHGFAGERVISEGAISLPVTEGEGRHQVTLLVDFLIVNVPSVHNVILGRPSLNVMRVVVSTYHLMMKFFAEGGIGYLRGDQHEARKCYMIAMKINAGHSITSKGMLQKDCSEFDLEE
ncbi:uncharacterized protein LOC131239050 [Magnolia sinica]|uniref:uncharacterized protein LOC131239050 n=1 Tax=Magnolia sinica TaxID=86752 RepID=UPI00265A4568|nr:uncharacterized protein LOC131239050 [Magnolia sinica]